jgi:hypothetical protein
MQFDTSDESHTLFLNSCWRKIAITLRTRRDPGRWCVVGVNAFHEKAGRSQGDSFWYVLVTLFLPSRVATVATLPSALFDERFSLGASWVFSFQPVLPPVYRPVYRSRFHLEDGSWARRLTQSPELGFRLWLFLSQSVFGFMPPPASLSACYGATVRKPLRLPTIDAAAPPAFAPRQ